MSVLKTGDFVRVIAQRGELVIKGIPPEYAGCGGKIIDAPLGLASVFQVAFSNGQSWLFTERHLEVITLREYVASPEPPPFTPLRQAPPIDFPGHPLYRVVAKAPTLAFVCVELTTTQERRWVPRHLANLSIPEAFFDADAAFAPDPADISGAA